MDVEVSNLKHHSTKRLSRRLTAAFVRQIKRPGRHGDGNGLYLIVDPSGASRWMLRVQVNGRRRDIGLGGTDTVSLSEARDLAYEVRRKAKHGLDPVAARRAVRDGVPTFEACAKIVHAAHLRTWKADKHASQWLKTLETYAFPALGKLSVNKVESGEVLKVLLPIWTEKPETARRVLQRMRTVFDHATAAGHRSGENPCRLAAIGLPKQTATVEHFSALPYGEIPDFLPRLRALDCAQEIKLILEFIVLTVPRSNEARGALKPEFDLHAKLWTVPGARTKTGAQHVVPLSPRVLQIVEEAKKLWPTNELLFPSSRTKGKLSDSALTRVLRRLQVNATTHGFRSTFRDWVSEETDFSGEAAEMALAHVVENKVEAAYRRGTLLDKRRKLMEAWALFTGSRRGG